MVYRQKLLIEKKAKGFRNNFCEIDESIDVVLLLDYCQRYLDKPFYYHIVSEEDNLDILKENYAVTSFGNATIDLYIREEVYEEAVVGRHRARFTIAHELGHLFLHNSLTEERCRLLARNSYKHSEEVIAYEEEADTFAAELLMPIDGIKGMSVMEIQYTYNVSRETAFYRRKEYQQRSRNKK